METTIGQLMINNALPEALRDNTRVMDSKSLKGVLEQVADKYPDRYAEVEHKLSAFSARAVTAHGGEASLSLSAFKTSPEVKKLRDELRAKTDAILSGPGRPEEKNKQIVAAIVPYIDKISDANFDAGLKARNPIALQVHSGSRGNKNQYRAVTAGDLLVTDHKDNPIPIPILSSYAEGLDPVQYWAGAYGARRGAISVKFATPEAGFLGKQLSLAAHRLIVTERDCGADTGIPSIASDTDNEGALLARDVGKYKAGTILTPSILKELGDARLLVRSPLTCQAHNGICQKCAGVRERGGLPPLGDAIGIAAAQAISEPMSQGALNVKHTGGQASGTVRKGKVGLDLFNQLIQVPKTFQDAAAIAKEDGRVEAIEPAPQGGINIRIGQVDHWAPPGETASVKIGDTVERGDVLSSGLPNPAEITHHKGIGEGRRYFTDLFTKALKDNGVAAHRRNVELVARGLINHARVTDVDGPIDTVPDDIVEYDSMVRGYTPRFGHKKLSPKESTGLYLEKPALHYSIGTRVTPSVVKALEEHKVQDVTVHPDPPSFVPEMTRAMETLGHSDDWMVRLGGFHLKKGLTTAVHRAESSDLHGTSYIPALAQGVEFGKVPKEQGY